MASHIPYGLDSSFNLEDMLCGRDEFVNSRIDIPLTQKKSMSDCFRMDDAESELENSDLDYFKTPTVWTGIDFKEEDNNNTFDQIVPNVTVSLPNPIDKSTPQFKYDQELTHDNISNHESLKHTCTIPPYDSPVKLEYFDSDVASISSSIPTTQPGSPPNCNHTDNVVPTSTKPRTTSNKRIIRRPSKISDDFTSDDEEDDDDDEYVPYKKPASSRSQYSQTLSDKYSKRDIRGPKHHPLDDNLLRRFTERDLVANSKSWRQMLKASPLTNTEKMRLKELRRRALSRTYSAEYRKRTMGKVKSNKPHGTPGRKNKKSTM